MEHTNILDEIDFDEWIYAGYVTTYRQDYKWLQKDGVQREGVPIKKILPHLEKPKPTHLCVCSGKPRAAKVVEDEDYLKDFKTTYADNYLPVSAAGVDERIEHPVVEEPEKEFKIPAIKLTDEEERIILRDYLARQKIKINRKRPTLNPPDPHAIIFD